MLLNYERKSVNKQIFFFYLKKHVVKNRPKQNACFSKLVSGSMDINEGKNDIYENTQYHHVAAWCCKEKNAFLLLLAFQVTTSVSKTAF